MDRWVDGLLFALDRQLATSPSRAVLLGLAALVVLVVFVCSTLKFWGARTARSARAEAVVAAAGVTAEGRLEGSSRGDGAEEDAPPPAPRAAVPRVAGGSVSQELSPPPRPLPPPSARTPAVEAAASVGADGDDGGGDTQQEPQPSMAQQPAAAGSAGVLGSGMRPVALDKLTETLQQDCSEAATTAASQGSGTISGGSAGAGGGGGGGGGSEGEAGRKQGSCGSLQMTVAGAGASLLSDSGGGGTENASPRIDSRIAARSKMMQEELENTSSRVKKALEEVRINMCSPEYS